MLPVRARGVWCETYHSKEVADSILGFLVPHGFVRALQRFAPWGDGRLSAGRLTCLDAVLQGGFEPEGEVMLAGHPRLLLPELDLLPVLVDGPFALRGPGLGGTYVYQSHLMYSR